MERTELAKVTTEREMVRSILFSSLFSLIPAVHIFKTVIDLFSLCDSA